MYSGLHYADKKNKICLQKIVFGKCLFQYKIRFAVEKKTQKKFGAISILGSPSKNASHLIFMYGNYKIV